MAIFLRHSYNVKPARWGSDADVMYAIRENSEKIYGVDPDTIALVMPLFWGFPLLDYSGKQNHGTPFGGLAYHSESLDFDGSNDYILVKTGIILADLPNATVMAICGSNAASSSGGEAIYCERGTAAEIWKVTTDDVTMLDKSWGFIHRDHDNTLTRVESTSVFVQTGKHMLTFVKEGTAIRLYKDGISDGSGTLNGTDTMTDASLESRIGGDKGDSGSDFPGPMEIMVCISNNITANQVALFSALPYGLYQPVSRPVYSIPAVVGLSMAVYQQHRRKAAR